MKISITNANKNFGAVKAVEDASFEIEDGEFFFILGPSGCGKTTLLRLIAGFYKPDSGEIRFGEKFINDVPPNKRNTGMVFQNYALWPHLSVFNNVAYGLRVRKTAQDELKERVVNMLKTVHMEQYAERFPNQLSGGQQQRIALARALVVEPAILLLDEPLSNLDAKLRLEMREEITRIQRVTGVTAMYVTHDQREAMAMGDRIAVMNEGRIIQIDTPREIYLKPTTKFVAAFMGEINRIPGKVSKCADGIIAFEAPWGVLESKSFCGEYKIGDEIEAMIRPESLGIVDKAPGQNVVESEVVSGIYLGSVEEITLKPKGDLLLKTLQPPTTTKKYIPGDIVFLQFPAEELQIIKD